ncbi:MAG: hypothetical protein H6970_14695 [Gammaproteobacteria bacterium]|nr:hypothetical protein [Gammaproteobacteria bacterium]MCP5458358.1 hypothetical protein [Gammaproteobacteria bacterium]
MSYQSLMAGGFVRGLLDQSVRNPRSLWIDNTSCHGAGIPNISHWIGSFPSTPQESSIVRLFIQGTNTHIKPYIRDLLNNGSGNDDAAAVSVALTIWQVPIPVGGGGIHDQGQRRVMIGTGSLNRDVNKGQVHCEHITTGIIMDHLDQIPGHYNWGRQAQLQSIDILIYTGKWSNKSKTSVQDFLPCGSCVKTLADVLRPRAQQIANVSNLGKALDYGG